jgi:hypothetical protein
MQVLEVVVHYLQWRGRKNTKAAGVSPAEIFVLVVMVGLIGMVAWQARSANAQRQATLQCSDKKKPVGRHLGPHGAFSP